MKRGDFGLEARGTSAGRVDLLNSNDLPIDLSSFGIQIGAGPIIFVNQISILTHHRRLN
jgi:hypothetical protein